MARQPVTRGKNATRDGANGKTKRKAAAGGAKGYDSPSWERVYLLSVELDALAKELGLHEKSRHPDGFDLADAARELARLALNHNRQATPVGRTQPQTKEDWVAAGGIAADLGNMADEGVLDSAADGVRAVAYELCYLVCDYLF